MNKLLIRRAMLEDLPSIVALLANDTLGASREDSTLPLRKTYTDAFNVICSDPNQFLAVAVSENIIVGTLQLTYLPNISLRGAWRAQIEAVRVHEAKRNSGLGRYLFEWAIQQARMRGCVMVQLTCDVTRKEAHHFYSALGFEPSHTGFKMKI